MWHRWRATIVIAGLVIVGLIVVGGAGYGGYYWYEGPDRETSKCNASEVGDLVKDAFDQSNLAHLERVQLVQLLKIRQTGFDRSGLVRTCTAVLEASDRSHLNGRYTIHPAGVDKLAVKLTLLRPEDTAAAP